jgi:uncharacterized Zn-binding protein involved in type VI secretion
MTAIARLGDMSTGHGCFPPTAMVTTPITKTYINGVLAGAADPACQFASHTCGTVTHPQTERYPLPKAGTKTYIEGYPIAIIGSDLNCGDAIAEGSPTTFKR